MISWPEALVGGAAALGAVTAYGAAWPRAQLFGPAVCRTDSADRLAITFDDGPNPAITPRLLDLLDRYEARATFFLIGRYVRECPDLVREIAARGHAIGNHTQHHLNLFGLGPAAIRRELLDCSQAIAAVTGNSPRWFRPPFGFRNPWLAGQARTLKLTTVMWTRIAGDWRAPSSRWLIPRMAGIAANARRNEGRPEAGGDILCLHDGGHRYLGADRTSTVAALEHWLPLWRDLGLRFVTMDAAVRAPAP